MKLNVNYVLLLTYSGIFGGIVHCNVLVGFSSALPKDWDQPEGKLIGGHSTTPSKHPYLVSLQTRFFIVRAHICGGTLLNENWILTAAHCIPGSFLIKWFPMDAIAGASNAHEAQASKFGPGTQIVTVDQRIPHPDFRKLQRRLKKYTYIRILRCFAVSHKINGRGLTLIHIHTFFFLSEIGPNDIAVLHTSSPFKFTKYVKPARLPVHFKTTYEHPLKLTGWGVLRTTTFFPDLPKYLQEVNVTYLPYKDCYKAVDNIKEAGEINALDEASNICTGPITGGVSACSGDSGGPLIELIPKFEEINDEDNHIEDHYPLSLPQSKGDKKREATPVVVGVVSWGVTPCGEKGAPTVYTKVEHFINFINKYIQF
ncbi:kallikrein 1-related peptidase b3-like [Choristoneura fumiferana]|uniref:kallikrein 1-related peptidase b3-like n=1 Tax=Choristoneura fumiferana TaxID=7141 RepID=UPI003D158721